MEILRIKVFVSDSIPVEGHAQKVLMLPFTGNCESPLFTGRILPGGVDTQRIEADGRAALSARYALEGTDCKGQACRLFIENLAVSRPGGETVTHPTIRTDSEALRWLENADLTGRIENARDHIEIVLRSEDTAHRRHIALRRGGLTLRGCLEKTVDHPCPLVLMLHGFGGCMDAGSGWLQEWSDALTAAGFATLRLDFNGHGQSEGRFCDMTPYNEIEDAAVFLQYALKLPDITDIYVLGHSQGGVIAGMLAGYYHDAVKKLVMLVPAASLKTDAQQGTCMHVTYDPQHIPEAVQIGANQVGGLFFRMAQTLPIYEVTAQFRGKALAILGGRDGVIVADSIRRYGACMANCRVVEKPTLDHGLGGAEHDETVQEVVAFLLDGEEKR
ncbi:MAG: alpha/beta fold hydrolase [Aristaeellaceae bacterium]